MKAIERYPDLNDQQRYLEYVLEILHSCLHKDGYTKAEEMINEAKEDAQENYPERIGQIDRAKEKFKIMKEYKQNSSIVIENNDESRSYLKSFRSFRNILMENI